MKNMKKEKPINKHLEDLTESTNKIKELPKKDFESSEESQIKPIYTDFYQILIRYTGERGDNEGMVEVLKRIIQERDILLRNGIKEKLLKLN